MDVCTMLRLADRAGLACLLLLGGIAGGVTRAEADEGGVSMWVPGFFGSLAAAPQVPGWSLASIYYHTSVSGGGDVAAARQITKGGITANVSVDLSIDLDAKADLALLAPSYVFATPVLGGQAAVLLVVPMGRSQADVSGTLTASAGPLGFTVSGSAGDSVTDFGDLGPQASLRWNHGVHNTMTYAAVDVPVGAYDPKRLANLGIGHWAVDAGGGYTYLNPETGREFSAVIGFTYNFENPDTDYQNGVDFHLDWGASQFVTKQLQLGVVGYAYQQLTGDSGSGAKLGDFKSRVLGIGPQIGYVIPLGAHQGYVNLKGYREFDAEHRADGWNAWLTFVISPAPPTKH